MITFAIEKLAFIDGRGRCSRGTFSTDGISSLFDGSCLGFIPGSLKRRCSPLTKMALSVANEAMSEVSLKGDVPTVFASRHGESSTTASLLRDLSCNMPISPMDFSLSVHNTASGIHSISHKAEGPSSAIAAGDETFICGLVDAALQLKESASPRILLLAYDELVPDIFGDVADNTSVYAVGLLMTREGKDSFTLRVGSDLTEGIKECHAMAFLDWYRSGSSRLALCGSSVAIEIDRKPSL